MILLPNGDEIHPIPEFPSRFDHVIRHLYTRVERWELAIEGLPGSLRLIAQKNGCGNLRLASYYGVCKRCQSHVLEDHDLWYQPAYMDSVCSAIEQEHWGCCDESSAHVFVGNNGVLVLTKVKSNHENSSEAPLKHFVVTAYRVKPRGTKPLLASQEDFFHSAVRKFRDKTSFQQERDS